MTNKQPICFVVSSPFTANGFLINHLIELSKLYEVSLFLNLSQYELSPKIEQLKIKIVNIPIERRTSIFKDIQTLILLFNHFRKGKFVSVHSITPKAGLLAISAAFFARIPHRHHTFTGQIWANSVGIHRVFYKKIDWLIGLLSTVIMADSVSQVQLLIREQVCRRLKILVLGPGSISGVDIDVFKPSVTAREKLRKQFYISESTCLFLYLGRLSKDKGIDDLLEAYSGLKAKHRNVALWVVGPDEEGIAARVKAINPELYSSIEWFGASFNPEIYMASADVLLLPSYREGFGTVIIEAAASSIPTLAYRIDGVVDAVLEGDTGLLASLGDVHDFRNQMDVLYADPELRMRLGASAQKRAHKYFSSKYITQIWVDFYLRLIPVARQ